MSIPFTAADRLAITRRQLNILLENSGYTTSLNTFTSQQTLLLQVDTGNEKFYDYYNQTCQSYEAEGEALDGQVAAEYSPSDITNAGQNPTTAPFFPTSGSTAYTRNLPLIQDGSFTNNEVRGWFYPTSQNVLYELNLVSGLSTLITYYLAGSFGSSSTSTSTTVPAGDVSNLTLSVSSSPGVVPNDLVYIYEGSGWGVYTVVSVSGTIPYSITVSSLIPSELPMTSPTIDPTQTGLQTALSNSVSKWNLLLSQQTTALGSQNEDRATYISYNSTALTNANAALSATNTWLSTPDYTSGGLSPLQTQASNRTSFIPTRVSQVSTALGFVSLPSDCLSQSGETFSAVDETNPYYKRFTWINLRINRAFGSLRRYYDAGSSSSTVQQLLDANNEVLSQYNSYFLTKAVTFNDGSSILHLTDLTGLSVADSITAVSETQPELSLTILELLGTTQVKVSQDLPTSYTVADKARIFKTLQ